MLQARGSFYLGNSPLKLEYATYVSNGLNVTPATPGSPTADEVANLENMTDTFAVISNDKAFGGRLGLWWPEKGLEGGISAMHSGDYLAGSPDVSMNLWALDLNYHKGNWDARFEYGTMYQQTPSIVVNGNTNTLPQSNIRREGLYAQVAYRPWDAATSTLRRTEFVYRFGWADFHGIDPDRSGSIELLHAGRCAGAPLSERIWNQLLLLSTDGCEVCLSNQHGTGLPAAR